MIHCVGCDDSWVPTAGQIGVEISEHLHHCDDRGDRCFQLEPRWKYAPGALDVVEIAWTTPDWGYPLLISASHPSP